MDWGIIIAAVVAGLVIGLVIIFRREAKKSVTFLEEAAFVQHMRKAQLVDLRKKEEFDAAHINGARHIPAAVLTRQPGRLRNDLPIYLIDANGKTVKRAALLLYGRGYENIYALSGGMNAYSGATKASKK